MKKKLRIVLITLVVMLVALIIASPNEAFAATRSLSMQYERPYSDDDGDGNVGNDIYRIQRTGPKLYNFVKIYDTSKTGDNSFSNFIYCLRGGKGFGADEGNASTPGTAVNYNELGEMHTDLEAIIDRLSAYSSEINQEKQIATSNGDTYNVNLYNAILWIADNAYLPKNMNSYIASDYKKELLDKIGVATVNQNMITDDDIEVVQQLAFWYFANYDEQIANNDGSSLSIGSKTPFSGSNAIKVGHNETYEILDNPRAQYLDKLYNYFIDNAIENASNYGTGNERKLSTTKPEFTADSQTKIKMTEVIRNTFPAFKIGPFKVNQSLSIDTIKLTDKNNNEILKQLSLNGMGVVNTYDIATSDTAVAITDNLAADTEYYIYLFKDTPTITSDNYDLKGFKLKLPASYYTTTVNFLATDLNEDQPLLEILKDKETFEDELVVENKKFDLALRKYITKIESAEGTTKAIKDKNGNDNARNLTNIDLTPLTTGETTADYKHRKDPVVVEPGDMITYRLATYNEGDVAGYVESIIDYLPEHLEFVVTQDFVTQEEVNNADFLTPGEGTEEEQALKEKVNAAKYIYSFDQEKRLLEIKDKQSDFYMAGGRRVLWGLEAFNGEEIDSKYLEIKLKVDENFVPKEDTYLTNVATMQYASEIIPFSNYGILDRDSKGQEFEIPSQDKLVSKVETDYKGHNSNKDELNDSNNHYKGQQDDDDFEKLVVKGKPFDLALRKFITKVNGEETETSREPKLDMTKFEIGEETTARYVHPKDSVVVKQGDIVTYKIRVYNEGQRDGFATEVTDYLPEGLGLLVEHNNNIDNKWLISPDSTAKTLKEYTDLYEIAKGNLELTDFNGLTTLDDVQIVAGKTAITSSLLKDKELKAYDSAKTTYGDEEKWQKAEEGKGTTGLYYEDIEVTCIVLAPNSTKNILKNIAEITKAEDENGVEIKNPGDDRDSVPGTVDEDRYHKPTEDKGYWPGEQDDDDFEPLVLQYFDLALRKFITGVNNEKVTTRYPQLSIDEKTGNIVYKHPKEEAPVEVATNDIVTYTLRIYNEGTKAGYADLVTDDIPEGLEFLPENAINKENRWVMYREVEKDEELKPEDVKIEVDGKEYVKTEDASLAKIIQTDYLSKSQGQTRMKDGESTNPALLQEFDSLRGIAEGNPDYADIKVAFRVTEPNTSDRIVINSAQISHDTDDKGREIKDEDSETNKWNDGEDDQDKEYIKVKYFDLSLYKWVTKTIVTVDGTTTTTETGFKPNIGKTENITDMEVRENSEEEPIAAVSIDKKKLKTTTVKFAYSIMIMNEGEIAGSASEITDFIPEGLEFNVEDNTAFGWEEADENRVTTRCLDGLILQPGESATIDIVFTWKNSADNLGLKTNIAEITEDFNENGAEDIDSIPDDKIDPYKEEQEDDDDFALVILELDTGSVPTYFALTTIVLTIIAGGVLLIKKYVLK